MTQLLVRESLQIERDFFKIFPWTLAEMDGTLICDVSLVELKLFDKFQFGLF